MRKIAGLYVVLLLLSLSLWAEGERRYYGFSKKEFSLLKEIERSIQHGNFGEASSLIDAHLTKKARPAFKAMLYAKRCWLRTINLQGTLAEKNLASLASVLPTLLPSEKEVVLSDLVHYFCFTGQIQKADSVYSQLSPFASPSYMPLQCMAKANLKIKQGYLTEATDLLAFSSDSLTGYAGAEEWNMLRHCLRIRAAMEYGLPEQTDSLLKNFPVNRDGPNGYYQSKRWQLQAQWYVQQKKYQDAASAYLKSISNSGYQPQALDYLVGMLGLIEAHYRMNNTLDGANYLRRLQAHALVSAGKKEMPEVAYELAFAISGMLQGDFQLAEKRLAIASSLLQENPLHPFSLKLQELQREVYLKTAQVDKLMLLDKSLSASSLQRSAGKSLEYYRRKLTEAMDEATFLGKWNQQLSSFKRYYSEGLSRYLHANAEERLPIVFAIGEAFYNADKPDSSVVFHQEALRISEQRYGPNSGQAMVATTRLIKALFLQAEYTKGLELLNPLLKDQAALKTLPLAMQEKTFLLLAELTKITGETALNKMFLTKALSLQHKRQVPDVLLLAEAEEQYAYVYIENSNYYRAGKSLEKALSLKRKFLPEQSPLLISTYQQLASLRILTGDLQAADSYLSPLGSITQATFGKEAVKTAEFKLILAEYLISIADYKAAQKELKEADKILTSKLRASHLSRIPVLMAMASVLDKLGETPGSINENYQQAMKVVQLSIGKNTSLYAGLLKTYATWQIGQGKIKEALVSLGEAEKYWKQKSGQTLALAEISGLYGEIAFKSTTYSEALLHFRQAAEMYKNVFNEKHPRYTEMVGRCARMTYLTGDPDKAVALMEEIIPTFLEFTTTHFPVLSFRQKALYWSSIREEFEFFHNLAFLSKSSNPSLWSKALNYSMATKGILLSSNSKLLNQIYSSNDSLLIAQYHQWVSLKEELVSSIGLSKKELEESGIDRNDLETRIENQEKEMSTRSQLFLDNAQKSEVPGWKFIAQQLQPDEVVLEMIRFRKYVAGFTDSSAYAVLSFSKAQSEPSLVVLPNGFAMERRFLKYYRNATTGKMNDEFSYGTYWQPIKNAIEDGKHIYVSTDGVYTQLNIEMLRLADGSYAIDHNSFVYITTTRDLQYLAQERKGKTKPKKNNAEVFVVCGNPQFYSNSFSGPQKNIAALPGTAKEIEIIKSRWDAAGKTSKMFSDRYANEDTLKSIKNPVVLHIATHGMFKESKQRSKDDLAANPLLNCGILLSEAGDILDNKSNSYVNQKDGILTAFEAMDLPLDQTELVVLSACETGRGEVEAGEGVAGLQRSFLMAGSKAVVVSLFKVNDDVTQQLMDHFYNYWLSSGNKVWAFAEAKRTIKKEFRDPIYWGAFILVEGKPERVVNK